MFSENTKIKSYSISPQNLQAVKIAKKSFSQKNQFNFDEKSQKNKYKTPNLKNVKPKIQINSTLPPKPQVMNTTPIKVDIPTNIKYEQNIKVPSHIVQMKKNYQYHKLYNILPALSAIEDKQQYTTKSITNQLLTQNANQVNQVNLMDMCLIPSDSLQKDDEESKNVLNVNKQQKIKCIAQSNGQKLQKRKLKQIDKQKQNFKMPNSLNANNLTETYIKKKTFETSKIRSIIQQEPKQSPDSKQPMSAGGYQTYQLSQISKFTTLYNNKKSYL